MLLGMQLIFPNRELDLSQPRVMGILNVTPDSFSDGGLYAAKDAALAHVEQMLNEGADIIDVGGESTRPGATAVSAAEEIDRVVPVIEALRQHSSVPISVDTSKPEVMLAAARAGASMINDVRALEKEGALEAAADTGLPVCVMHMQGQPATMQEQPTYSDVVREVQAYLDRRIAACKSAGIQNVVIDPGFGFGKTLEHNLSLFRALPDFAKAEAPLLIGVSRKSMIGAMLGDMERDRTVASVVMALAAVRSGAHILRVHDVQQTVDALRIEAALQADSV
ncbi:MAG: dihydropteroate synthase [Gammaproteobacteria bacterium]